MTDSSQDWRAGQSTQTLKPGLYVIATPLGNLRDITLRALDILAAADVIYCEDTRVTQKLCSAYGIKAALERSDEHTEMKRVVDIVRAIQEGKVIALVSDAGTPGISDPGMKIVAACRAQNMPVYPVPGASAAVAALSASGIVTDSFSFLGFLSTKSGVRRQDLQTWKNVPTTLIVYEAPQRVAALLQDIVVVMGQRRVIIAREITKLYERFYDGTPDALAELIDDDSFKGEVVVLIAPGAQEAKEIDLDGLLQEALAKTSLKEAVAQVTAATGLPRKTVYARALALGRNDARP